MKVNNIFLSRTFNDCYLYNHNWNDYSTYKVYFKCEWNHCIFLTFMMMTMMMLVNLYNIKSFLSLYISSLYQIVLAIIVWKRKCVYSGSWEWENEYVCVFIRIEIEIEEWERFILIRSDGNNYNWGYQFSLLRLGIKGRMRDGCAREGEGGRVKRILRGLSWRMCIYSYIHSSFSFWTIFFFFFFYTNTTMAAISTAGNLWQF